MQRLGVDLRAQRVGESVGDQRVMPAFGVRLRGEREDDGLGGAQQFGQTLRGVGGLEL